MACRISPSPVDEAKMAAKSRAGLPAFAAASSPAASANRTHFPARRRSVAGSASGAGKTVGTRSYGARPARTSRAAAHPANAGPTTPTPSIRAARRIGLLSMAEDEAAVGAAESERIAHHARETTPCARDLVIRAERRIELPGSGAAGDDACAHGEDRQGG